MSERRDWKRFEASDTEENVVLEYRGQHIPGIAVDVSQGGLSVVVMGTCQIEIASEVILTYRGIKVPVAARNVDLDMATTVIGLEWTTGPIPALQD